MGGKKALLVIMFLSILSGAAKFAPEPQESKTQEPRANDSIAPELKTPEAKKDLEKKVVVTPSSVKPNVTEPTKSAEKKEAIRTPLAPEAVKDSEKKEPTITPSKITEKLEKNSSEKADIFLNFENASLLSVVNYISGLKKINLIPDKGLEARKVSLTVRHPITLTGAWNAMLTLLEMNGFTIIDVDNLYRIVPNTSNKSEPLPLYSSLKGVEPENLPDKDMVVRYVYVLKNISPGNARMILSELLGQQKVYVNEDLATCILTDKCYNIKSAMKIIKELDTGGMRESIKIYKLKYTDAEEVATLFTKDIMEGGDQGQRGPIRFFGPREQKEITYFSNTTKIISEKRQNHLILLGQEENIDKIMSFINKYIDVPIGSAESRIHIKELKYVDAQIVGPIIQKMVRDPQGSSKGRIEGQFKTFEDVIVHAENPKVENVDRGSGNRLIISCGKNDWLRLEKLIDKLDKPQPQIALEAMVVDLDELKERELGAQIREKTGKSLVHGGSVFTSNLADTAIDRTVSSPTQFPNLINVASGDQGTTAFTAGKIGDIWLVIKTFLSETNTNIIEQPFLVTRNNEESKQTISYTKRVPGKLTMDGRNGLSLIEDVPAKTELTITPRINVEGLIDLYIKIELSEFVGIGDQDAPTRTSRTIETRASIGTGEVLVLGGLTKQKITEKTYKTPILGSIPLIGNLFRGKEQERGKTNLYLFVRPSILKPRFEGGPDEYTRLKLDYAKYQILNAEGIRESKDPIQRWFFSPEKQTVKQKLDDIKSGVYRPVDEYADMKNQPKEVRIERDPYYRSSEAIRETERREKQERQRQKLSIEGSSKLAKAKEPIYLPPSLRKRHHRQA